LTKSINYEATYYAVFSILLLLQFPDSLSISWNRIFLEKLRVALQIKEFQALYGSRRLIILLTGAGHWTLSESDESYPRLLFI
jgi:hypothetical protein